MSRQRSEKRNEGISAMAVGTPASSPSPPARPSHGAPGSPMREVKPGAPDLDRVRTRAYELYQARARAGKPGDPASDWLQAERELRTTTLR